MKEDELIAAIRAIVETAAAPNGAVALGIGDDAAAWQPSRSHLSVVTTDALVDGVHFLGASMEPEAIGHRALASNLSDIAAMGARPVLATIALGVAPGASEEFILGCYRGLAALARRAKTRIVGGDVVRAPATMLSITLIGEVSRTRMKTRAGGKARDVLAVTGALGASRAGLELVRDERARFDALEASLRSQALRAFSYPEPRLREGRFFAASVHVHAMMDLSDGLSTDVPRFARAAGCGAALETIPVHSAAAAVARLAGEDAERFALDGGEDFELLVAVQPRAFEHLARRFESLFGKPLLRIGTLERGDRIVRRTPNETDVEIEPGGYDHLRDASALLA